jgi:hypothetical protein
MRDLVRGLRMALPGSVKLEIVRDHPVGSPSAWKLWSNGLLDFESVDGYFSETAEALTAVIRRTGEMKSQNQSSEGTENLASFQLQGTAQLSTTCLQVH